MHFTKGGITNIANCFFGRLLDYGVDVVVHSATEWVSGHGTTLGGIIIDSGNFDWDKNAERFPHFHSVQNNLNRRDPATFWNRFGPRMLTAYLIMLRDVGSSLSPFSAQQLLIGMETLSVRCERQRINADTLSRWLSAQSQVAWESYLGLEQHESHHLAKKYLRNGFCFVFKLALVGGQQAALKLIVKVLRCGRFEDYYRSSVINNPYINDRRGA